MATVKKKPETAKKHWFTDKKGAAAKAAYLKKHPKSVYHPSNQGPPKPPHIKEEQRKVSNRNSAAKSKTKAKNMKAVGERVEKYKALIKKGEQHFIKLGQRPKGLNEAKVWEESRKKILAGIQRYKLAIRGAQSPNR